MTSIMNVGLKKEKNVVFRPASLPLVFPLARNESPPHAINAWENPDDGRSMDDLISGEIQPLGLWLLRPAAIVCVCPPTHID